MTSFANIATLLFGTYDSDLSRRWVGDNVSHKIVTEGLNNTKLKRNSIFGIGTNLNMTEAEIEKAIGKETDPKKMLEALKAHKGLAQDADLVRELEGNLNTRYQSVGGFRNTTFLNRFRTNFNEVKNNDMIYQLAKGGSSAKEVFSNFGKEVVAAGAGKEGAKKILAQAGKIGGKSLPLIGTVITLACEIPAIFKSFSNYGAGEGIKQTGRSAVSIGGFAAGTAAGATIGSAVPVVGTIIGGIVGGMVGGFLGKAIFGKSKVEEAEEKKEQHEAVAQAQMAPQQAIQPSAFGTYSTPQAYGMQQAYPMPMFASRGGGISLGDENMMSNTMGTYRMAQMVA